MLVRVWKGLGVNVVYLIQVDVGKTILNPSHVQEFFIYFLKSDCIAC